MGPGWDDERTRAQTTCGAPTLPRRRGRLRPPPSGAGGPGRGGISADDGAAVSDVEAIAQDVWRWFLRRLADHDALPVAEWLDHLGTRLRGGWDRLVVPRLAHLWRCRVSRREADCLYLLALTLVVTALLCCGGRLIVSAASDGRSAGAASTGLRARAPTTPATTASLPAATPTIQLTVTSTAISTATPPPLDALKGTISVLNANDVILDATISVAEGASGQWNCGNTLKSEWHVTIARRATEQIRCNIYAAQYATSLPQSLSSHTFDTQFSQGPPRWIHYVNLSRFLPCSGSACAGAIWRSRGGMAAGGELELARARAVRRIIPLHAAPIRSQTEADLLRSIQRITPPSANAWAGGSTIDCTEGVDRRSWRVRFDHHRAHLP
jgi:hypothetical protein